MVSLKQKQANPQRTFVTVPMDAAMYEHVRQRAAHEDRTIVATIRRAIAAYLTGGVAISNDD